MACVATLFPILASFFSQCFVIPRSQLVDLLIFLPSLSRPTTSNSFFSITVVPLHYFYYYYYYFIIIILTIIIIVVVVVIILIIIVTIIIIFVLLCLYKSVLVLRHSLLCLLFSTLFTVIFQLM